MQQSISVSGVKRFSVYAKANTNDYLLLGSFEGAHYYATFNLATGAVDSNNANVKAVSIEDVGGGWYRCSATWIGTTTQIRIGSQNASGQGAWATTTSGSIFIQDAQAEMGLVATDVLTSGATTAKAGILEDMPRINYDANGENGALLLEPSRTNQIISSEYFDSSVGWESVGSFTPNAATSPEGLTNASSLDTDYLEVRPSVVSGTTYTYSIFVKSGTDSTPYIIMTGTSFPNTRADFDLSDGTITSYTTEDATIEAFNDGWYRVSVTETATATDSTSRVRFYCETSNIYGAQFEAGTYATSYIPTYGASVTRSVDDVNEKTSVSELIGQSEGTLFLDFVANDEDALQIIYQVRTTGSSNVSQIDIRIQGGNLRALGNDAGTAQFNISAGAAVAGTRYKCAVRYANNDVAFYVNGVLKGSDTSASFSSSALQQVSFSENTGTFQPSASIHQAILFPTRLTNTELASLTTL